MDANCDDDDDCTVEICDPANALPGDGGCVFTSLDQTLIIKQGASQHPPGNCPAPVNTHGHGVVKMVLIGDFDFAAETAVPGSLEPSCPSPARPSEADRPRSVTLNHEPHADHPNP